MELTLFNTLTRKKESFKPLKKGAVGMYTCGPTVYWFQHIGNLRTYVFSDILRKVLLYNGFKVTHVMNVTDVGHLTSDADEGEDKMELAAQKEGKHAGEIAQFYFDVFVEDLKKLHIAEPSKWVWASKHIDEQIDLIKTLEKNGFTYQTDDGVYFDSSKFETYVDFAKLDLKGLAAGKRVGMGEKKNKTDFALWKFADPPGKRQQEWDSPWGNGFPGWHVECSAMSMKYLGETFDIHTGGEDHVPIHHTNEIAQSEGATGKQFVNYWLHAAFLLHKGAKASKSTGGLYTVSELQEQGYRPEHLRYLFLLTHYRKQLNFSLDALDAAKHAFDRLERNIIAIKGHAHKGTDKTAAYEKQFLDAVNDDLNTAKALDVMWSVVDDFDFSPKKKMALLTQFDTVLGLGFSNMRETYVEVPKEIRELVQKREDAREQKDWAEADVLRNMITERGWVVEDSPEGVKVRKA